GEEGIYFGDSGVIDSVNDNVKFKLGYEHRSWSALLNVAYEDRSTVAGSPNSYLYDTAGHTVWSGNFLQNGYSFSLPASRLGVSDGHRQSLSTGLRVKARLGSTIDAEGNLSWFTVLRDEN